LAEGTNSFSVANSDKCFLNQLTNYRYMIRQYVKGNHASVG